VTVPKSQQNCWRRRTRLEKLLIVVVAVLILIVVIFVIITAVHSGRPMYSNYLACQSGLYNQRGRLLSVSAVEDYIESSEV